MDQSAPVIIGSHMYGFAGRMILKGGRHVEGSRSRCCGVCKGVSTHCCDLGELHCTHDVEYGRFLRIAADVTRFTLAWNCGPAWQKRPQHGDSVARNSGRTLHRTDSKSVGRIGQTPFRSWKACCLETSPASGSILGQRWLAGKMLYSTGSLRSRYKSKCLGCPFALVQAGNVLSLPHGWACRISAYCLCDLAIP